MRRLAYLGCFLDDVGGVRPQVGDAVVDAHLLATDRGVLVQRVPGPDSMDSLKCAKKRRLKVPLDSLLVKPKWRPRQISQYY